MSHRRSSVVIERKTVRAGNEPALALRFFDHAAGVKLEGQDLYAGVIYRVAENGG